MYRIKSKIYDVTNEKRREVFFIERKTFFGWRVITIDENNSSKQVEHASYQEAEEYLYSKYIGGWGEITKNGNVYVFSAYTMYY
jgi:hypothetical protein